MSATAGLMQEHQLILKYVDLMERCVTLNLQNPDLRILFAQAGRFIDFIREFADSFHHAKEENILFRILYPMAEQGLSDELKASISKEYAETETQLDSPAIWEKYEALRIKLENDLTRFY